MGRPKKNPMSAALPDGKEVRKEIDRLFSLFKDAPQARLELAQRLIERAAFLSVVIDQLERDIAKNGYQEEYQNGENQHGKKKSAAAELHVSYTKNLLAVMKQLNDMLAAEEGSGAGDEFENF